MHPFRREERELQLQGRGALVVPGNEGVDDMAGGLPARGRRGGGGGRRGAGGRARPGRSTSTISRDPRARSRELSLMSCTLGSCASATVSAIETSAPGPGL